MDRADDRRILRETIAVITRNLGPELDQVRVERAVAGVYFSGVKLGGGIAGACATPLDTIRETFCCPTAEPTALMPGRLRGCRAIDLARQAFVEASIRRSLGIAAINALADLCWQRRPHPEMELMPGTDAFDATDISPGERVVIVGAFVPFLRALKQRRQPFTVLEQNPALLKPDELPFFRRAEAAPEVMPEADVVLITGMTLVNDTIEDLLALVRPDARVTVVGPTVGLAPDAFLRRGVDILGSVRITNADAFLDVIGEGGGAHHFLGRSAQKAVLVRRPAAAKVA